MFNSRRRLALLGVMGVLTRAFGGRAEAGEAVANLTIPLGSYPIIKVVDGDEVLYLSGHELFGILKATKTELYK